MRITKEDKNALAKSFPKQPYCYYEKYNNNSPNIIAFMALPSGKKCHLWLHTYKNENCAFLIFDGFYVKSMACSFNEAISYGLGTIMYGTYFVHEDTPYFLAEDISYYCNTNVAGISFTKKLELFYYILNIEIKQVSYTNNHLVVAMPIIAKTFDAILKEIKLLPYCIETIIRKTNNNVVFSQEYYKNINGNKSSSEPKTHVSQKATTSTLSEQRVQTNKMHDALMSTASTLSITKLSTHKIFHFNVEMTPIPDIYKLFKLNGEYFDTAFIPDYKTSSKMNSLFGNCKHDWQDIKYIEESDDEDDSAVNDYGCVNKSPTHKMKCVFSSKFNKYIPLTN